MLEVTLSDIMVMANPHTGNKNRNLNLAASLYIINGPLFSNVNLEGKPLTEGEGDVRGFSWFLMYDCCIQDFKPPDR